MNPPKSLGYRAAHTHGCKHTQTHRCTLHTRYIYLCTRYKKHTHAFQTDSIVRDE